MTQRRADLRCSRRESCSSGPGVAPTSSRGPPAPAPRRGPGGPGEASGDSSESQGNSVFTIVRPFFASRSIFRASILSHFRYTQHCFLVLGPPNLGLSKQLTQEPQSCTRKQPRQCPQRAILIFLPWWEGSDRRGVWARAPADPVGSESPPGPADSTFSRWDREGTLSVSDADDVSSVARSCRSRRGRALRRGTSSGTMARA